MIPRLFLPLILALTAAALLPAADYHVDSQAGDDANSGLSAEAAWRSLDKVNATEFQPGDRILFKAGGSWSGQLRLRGSGTGGPEGPLVITAGKYGDGPLPRIDGEGRHLDTLLIENVEYWEIEDLEITNHGPRREPWRTGVRVSSHHFGTMRHIHLRRLHVRDVNGDLRKEHEGCGIYFVSTGRDSRFDDLLIEGCHVVRTDRNGICQRGARARSTNVIIRGNLLEDIGGDGIKLWGTNGGLIERNIVRNARARCRDHAAGIWPFSCDDTVIQFNEVSGTKGTLDGQAYDADYDCRRTLLQYNYSHGNEGGFMLICGPGRARNEGTIIRYNISVHDGINSARVFQFGGRSDDTLIHNNTIILGPGQDLPMILHNEWDGGRSRNARFANNLFIVAEGGRASYDFHTSTGNTFEHNLFVGRHEGLPAGVATTAEIPPLAGPLEPVAGMAALDRFRPRPGSEFPRGVAIENNGGRDFFGRPLPSDRPPAIGAAEVPPIPVAGEDSR